MAEFSVGERARQSAGESAAPVHQAVLVALEERGIHARCLLDVGCRTGNLRRRVRPVCDRYVGADAMSKLTLLSKNEFVQFQERPGLYPAHITALLEVDLVRMCRENGLEDIAVRYTGQGRVPLTPRDWPAPLRARSGARGRAFSDNVLVIARRP